MVLDCTLHIREARTGKRKEEIKGERRKEGERRRKEKEGRLKEEENRRKEERLVGRRN
jgi:hypothetical protein